MNLVPAIKSIEKEIEELYNNYKQKVQPYIDSLDQLRKINTACEKCNGRGKILRSRCCAEDDRPDPNDSRDYIVCPVCKGTGLNKKE